MNINLRKITALGTSALMVGMTMGLAAAASFPAPFSSSSASGVAVVSGTGSGVDDTVATNTIADYLATKVKSSGTTTVSGGDSALLAKSSDNLNLRDTWGVFTGTVDKDELSTLLADGTYTASDNDEFTYEQTIKLGAPTLTHFRDSDYESQAGLDENTPTLGFKLSSSTHVLNYTLDFITDAESDLVSGDLDDIEGSDIMLMGKTYYVSDFKNGTGATNAGKLTLLDSANTAIVGEDETTTVTIGSKTYSVKINYLDADEVRFEVDGKLSPSSGKLQVGQSVKLSDGAYLGVRDISKLEISGEKGSATFSIGSGKLEITSGSDIKLNDDTIQGVKGWVVKASGTETTAKIDKIVISWDTEEEEFLTQDSELVMPGFGALKFTMADWVRPTEEKVVITPDTDTSIKITVPTKSGDSIFNLLYSNASGEFTGLGKSATEKLVTTSGANLTFTERDSSGNEQDKWFVASYNSSTQAESYLLTADVKKINSGANEKNVTDIYRIVNGAKELSPVCPDKEAGKSCDIGDVTLTINTIQYKSGNVSIVQIDRASANVNFNTIYTAGGLRIYLPLLAANGTTSQGAINLTADGGASTVGHNYDSFYLYMDGEDKDDTIVGGTQFSFTIDDTTNNRLEIKSVNTTGGGVGSGSGGENGLEVGKSSKNYEAYVKDDVAPRIMHYTGGDEDYAEVYYPTGDSESYAKVYLAEASASATSGAGGSMVFKDNEKSTWQNRDVVLVGGSCINSATATALGVATGTCAADFKAATGVGSGEYMIKSVGDAFTSGKVALVVAGYSKADTQAAATKLTTDPTAVDTAAGKTYRGLVANGLTSTFAEA